MSAGQVFSKFSLPLALPVILSGIRIAVVATIGSAVIAQTVNAGGIGVLLFEGLRSLNVDDLGYGTGTFLALVCNFILEKLEHRALLASAVN